MFDKCSTLKAVFYGQYRFKGKPSQGFIRRPVGNRKISSSGWLKYDVRPSQPLRSKASPQENAFVTRFFGLSQNPSFVKFLLLSGGRELVIEENLHQEIFEIVLIKLDLACQAIF